MSIVVSDLSVNYRNLMRAELAEHCYDTSFAFAGLIPNSYFKYDASVRDLSSRYRTGLSYTETGEMDAPPISSAQEEVRVLTPKTFKMGMRYNMAELNYTATDILRDDTKEESKSRNRMLTVQTMKALESPVYIHTSKYVASGGNIVLKTAAEDGVVVESTPSTATVGLKLDALNAALATHQINNPADDGERNYILMTPYEFNDIQKDALASNGGVLNPITDYTLSGMAGPNYPISTTLKLYGGYLIKQVSAFEKGSPLTYLEYGHNAPVIEDIGGGVYHLIRRLPIVAGCALTALMGYTDFRVEEEANNIGVLRKSSMIKYGAMRLQGPNVSILPVRVVIDPSKIPYFMANGAEVRGMDSSTERSMKQRAEAVAARNAANKANSAEYVEV